MVDAGAPQHRARVVDGDALFPVPGQGTDAEASLRRVAAEAGMGGIELGALRRPQGRAGEGQGKGPGAAPGGQNRLAVPDFHTYLAGSGSLDLHPDGGRVDGQRGDTQAVDRDMRLLPHPQPHRAVDAGAGIPPGVGLVGVAGDDRQLVFPLPQPGVQVHIEIGVAIGAEGGLLAVEPHLGIAVHALKFQGKALVPQGIGQGERLAVFVIPAGKPGHIAAAGGVGRARLGAHGVVGHRDGDGFPLPAHGAAGPAAVEIQLFHTSSR